MITAEVCGDAYLLHDDQAVIGRTRGDMTFPDDAFVSSTHCKLTRHGEGARLTDLGSSNGTFLKIREQVAVDDGDLIMLGQQLFQVQSDGPR